MAMSSPPNDRRNFVHKRIGRAVAGFATGGPAGAALGFARGGGGAKSRLSMSVFTGPTGGGGMAATIRRLEPNFTWEQIAQKVGLSVSEAQAFLGINVAPARKTVSRSLTARPGPQSVSQKALGRALKFSSPSAKGRKVPAALSIGIPEQIWGFDIPCFPGFIRDEVDGKCKPALGEQVGRDDTPIGEVVMGRYGAGEMPGNMVVNRAVCRPGMVIGDDGVCYNKSQIKNSEREWPRGRRPLLTGGDMRAISTAARAGRRLERTTKRLQKIGMMKKPAPRSRRLPAHQHQITSGG